LRRYLDRILLSATDLVTFHECEHATALDRAALDDPALRAQRCTDDETGRLMQRRGGEFERRYLDQLRREHGRRHGAVVEIAHQWDAPDAAVTATFEAMRGGAEVIYQATLRDGDLVGHADFLRKVPGQSSALGDHAYEVVDTKLGRHAKARYVLQLAFYSELVAQAQQAVPREMHVVLGSGEQVTYGTHEHARYFRRLLQRFRAAASATPDDSYPTPCVRCEICHWRERCEKRRAEDDSLWLVAGIRSGQVGKLEAAGVRTLAQLGRLPATQRVPQLAQPSFDKLREQAEMQLAGRETGQPQYRVIDHGTGVPRGFGLLPAPDAADVYFDMEGDPLFGEGGLEYLFGVLYREQDATGRFAPDWTFKAFWGHGRDEERRAFEAFMDWLAARIARHPALHVYHYAAYEDSALKRLSARHATREALLDQLLRAGRLVDLFKVVREGVRCSTPSYSIKHIEKFYRGAREGEVTTAGASIVYYERWLETREPQLLADIERYNEDDVRSLQQLHAWLQAIQPRASDATAGTHEGDPADAAVQATNGAVPADRAGVDGQPSQALQQYLQEVEAVREPLLATLPADRTRWTAQHAARALLADLLEFHRRCEKPQWWEMFARTTLSFEELLDSVDAVAGLTRVPGDTVGEYAFPAQELKFEAGDYALWLEHPQLATVRMLEIDEERRRLRLAPTRRSGPLPDTLSLGKGGPIDAMVLKQALLRVGRSVVAGDHHYRALEALLEKRPPKLTRRKRGQPVVADPAAPLDQVIEAVARLDHSHLFIQGPPGAGKTYTASHVIAALLRAGKRVAVSSNSHKAINNLLAAVEEVVLRDSSGAATLRACKKVSRQDESTCLHGAWIRDVEDVDEALSRRWQLVGGTAWLFARPEADQQFDYLFVDEAGQVSLGNLAAMATCARNLVLLGDQMQLSQPIQGVHPGRSGESTLDFLLDGRATVPPELGIFLPQTWRMGPDVCRFISEAIYDGRLEPEPRNANQRLVLGASMHPALRPTGVVFWPVEHAGCAQRSDEEAEEIRRIYTSLLGGAVDPATGATLPGASWIDRDGVKRRLTVADVLVVAPYNLQVNLLRRVLPDDARVGTVDKFQGQEAAVSIVSMTTSSEDELPRNLEFLFSRNRLNVAISRARCLSIVVASPRLLDTRCRTPEQIALVNLLCWAAESSPLPFAGEVGRKTG